jgi:hypothetical protein
MSAARIGYRIRLRLTHLALNLLGLLLHHPLGVVKVINATPVWDG